MIQIIDTSGVLHPISNYERLHITHKQDGNDICSFILNTSLPEYALIREEAIIRTYENEYLIKKIDDDKIDCKLNFDFLKQQFHKNFASRTKTLAEVLAAYLPSGWTVEGAEVSTIRRSITFDYCTDYDVIMACPNTYDVKFIWHILEKRLVVVKPELTNPSGEYVTSDLNLRRLSFKGQSVNFATRLYAYGKDGMTLEEAIVDGQRYGLEYVEDNAYSDKVICAYWKDERYTVPDNLYDDAIVRLAALSQPARSYECRIDDLAKRDERYRFLDFAMHKVISLLDSERKIAVNHQIVEYDEWPDEPQENNVTLSCVTETIQETIHTVAQQLHEEIDEQKEIVKAEFEVQDDRINAKVSKIGGENTSFGWTMTDTYHKWYANSREVMGITADGVNVIGSGTFTGEIRASSGYIGNAVNGFAITSRAIANGMESLSDTTHNGVYVGTDGLALGAGKFKVTSSGAVTARDLALNGGSISLGDDGEGNPVFRVTNQGAATAKSLNLTGGSISLGDDGTGNPVFRVTNAGAVTAKNLTLTGGSINIADTFKVSSSGVLTANMTGGSITLGENFAVTNTGAVTAKNLTLTGGSISLGKDANNNPIFQVTSGGVVTAKSLNLNGGSININDTFKVSSTGVMTANMTGGSITLGQNFAVTSSGAVTAKNLTLTGGSISLGDDGSGNAVFKVTSSGAVTAKNLALTGGSINIKDGNGDTAFSVSNTGAVSASNLSISGGSISINNGAFRVDSDGNLYASSGNFDGNVRAENIKSNGVDGYGGSLSGSALSQQSVPGNRVVNNDLTTGQFASGVNTSLGYANAYNSATQQGTNTYPAYFSAGQIVARSSFYSGTYYVALAGDTEGTINNHTHQISADSNGVVTIGAPDFLGNPHSFNIADTAFYKAAISAREITAITATRETSDANVVWNSSNKTISASYTLTAKHNSTVLGTEREYSITIPATKAYNAGVAAGESSGAAGVSISAASYYSYSTSADQSVALGYSYVRYDSSTDRIRGRVSVTLSNGVTGTIFVEMDASRKSAPSVSISSVDQYSYSSSANFTTTFDNSYVRYSNGYICGRASISLSDGSRSTVYIEMDGTRAYNAGAGSVAQRSVDENNCSYIGGVPYNAIRIYFNDGNYQDISAPSVYNPISGNYDPPYSAGYDAGYNAGWGAGVQYAKNNTETNLTEAHNSSKVVINYNTYVAGEMVINERWEFYL